MPNYRLTYFDSAGRGETTRMVFGYAGVPFEDNRIDQEQWKKLKPNTPWGTLPILEVDGHVIGQSKAVHRYVAKQVGLAGKNPIDCAIADSIVDAVSDMFDAVVPIFFAADKQKKGLLEDFVVKKLKPCLSNLEKILKANKGGRNFFVGEELTYADLHFYNAMENVLLMSPEAFDGTTKLKELYDRIGSVEKVKSYIASRP